MINNIILLILHSVLMLQYKYYIMTYCPTLIITDSYSMQLREACRDIRRLAAEGKGINELRKTKQKYISQM